MTKDNVVHGKKCPICQRPTLYAARVAEDKEQKKTALWYRCLCGIMFQEEPPKKVQHDKAFIDAHYKLKEHEYISIHAARMYANLVEELTYGRKLLDVGYCTPDVINYFSNRGWIAYGIDLNKDIKESWNIMKGDFETKELYSNTYDVVWMSFVLEQLHDPIVALKKVYNILQNDGVLYIATPDIDFLYTDPQQWPHWRRDDNYVMWSTQALKRELERIGFEIRLNRRNFASRFGYYHDIQLICQKIYF